MDACENRRNNWEELAVTKEEFNNLNECLKKKEFRDLLIEYAKEVSSPESRKLYQQEITELEKERGVDVTFVNAEPGYVIKTSLDGDKKCFVNISKSDIVVEPTSQPSQDKGHPGLQWSIPYHLSPPRDDLDKKNCLCKVFDVVFHPDTLYLASKNARFRDTVNQTALDGIEMNFKVKLDRNNLKFPKTNFKGISQSTVVRKKCEKPQKSKLDVEPEIYQKIIASYDEAREKNSKQVEEKKSRPTPPTKYLKNKQKYENENPTYTTPKYIIKHQTDLDIQDFKNSKDSKMNAAIPKNLVIVIDLPLLRAASDVTLDVQEFTLTVSSEKPAKYRLELPLPYRIDPDHGNAKFDTTIKKLTVTLPVIRKIAINDYKNDSGVESDLGSPPSPSIVDQPLSNNHIENDSKNVLSMFDTYDSSNDLISEITEQDECDDTTLRTNDNVACEEPIMSENIIYSLPQFTPNIFENTLALTVHVKNVDSTSIRSKFLNNNSGIHLTFSSVGAGFFPVYYSLCFKLKDEAFEQKTLTIEPWDNNIVITINLKNVNELLDYYVGINEEFMEEKDLIHGVSFEKMFESLKPNESQQNPPQHIQVLQKENVIVVNIGDSDDEDAKYHEKFVKPNSKSNSCLSKSPSMSESSGDELSSSNCSESSCRGILKHGRSNFSRSVSKSSIGNTAGSMNWADFKDDSVQESNFESDCHSLKKTVRFNEVVSRQLYRPTSSILGRRKKNQRKLQKKKQAYERRMSESENSETEERDKYKVILKTDYEEEKEIENVKPILNQDKATAKNNSNSIETEKSMDDATKTLLQTEFKNDLIFDLDM